MTFVALSGAALSWAVGCQRYITLNKPLTIQASLASGEEANFALDGARVYLRNVDGRAVLRIVNTGVEKMTLKSSSFATGWSGQRWPVVPAVLDRGVATKIVLPPLPVPAGDPVRVPPPSEIAGQDDERLLDHIGRQPIDSFRDRPPEVSWPADAPIVLKLVIETGGVERRHVLPLRRTRGRVAPIASPGP